MINALPFFIDFHKAFDLVSHSKVWYKLKKLWHLGVGNEVIKSLHLNSKLYVFINGELSNKVRCNVGVYQGRPLSPNLFSLFINDLT